jgi:RES domain-containing protein
MRRYSSAAGRPLIKADDLPKNWQAQLEVTRDLGTAWLEENESVLLRVPSVIVPETVNLLLNPSHKLAAKFRITDVFPYPFDLRLKR